MPEPVRVGVVGLGIRGFWLSHLARQCSETELVAMADLRDDMLGIAREKFPGVDLHRSGEEMAQHAPIDAVVVATGDRFHAQNAREALLNGKPVLIEKPMAQSFDDLREIARLQKQTGLAVGTFLELRFNPIYRRAAEIIRSGEIGRVLAGSVIDHVGRDRAQFFARARTRSREAVVSLVVQKGVHSLDLLNGFMGSSPRRVAACGGLLHFGGDQPADKHCRDCADRETCPHASSAIGRLEPVGIEFEHGEDFCVWSKACDVEDVTLINIEYASGAVATYQEVHFAPHYGLHITVYGDQAQLDIEANHDTREAWIEVTERFTRTHRREQPSDDTGHGNADEELLADFACAVREGRPPSQGLRSGFESAVIAIGARHSIDTGAFIDLPQVDDAGKGTGGNGAW
jgi:predicted dehydrogenase